MIDQEGTKHSEYMQWAKLHSQARFNLATSGVQSVSSSEFPPIEELEITGTDSYGYKPLLERIAQHAGAPVECVVTAAGTSMANQLAMAAMLNPGDEVLIEQPAYGPLIDVANYLGARVRRIERKFETAFAVDPHAIEKALRPATRLIVLTNLHNPSGALIPAETLRAIAAVAQPANIRVLVDEAYLEMLFAPDVSFAFPIGASFGTDNPFIITNSLTKTHGLSGLRCGWILAAPDLAHRIWRLNDLFGVNAPHPAEQLSVLAFDRIDCFRERARKLLNANRVLLDDFLDSRSDLECFRPRAGSVVFPRLKRGDTEAFVKLLREKYETSVVPGKFFELPQHFRIGIGSGMANVKAGLERLAEALDEFGKQ